MKLCTLRVLFILAVAVAGAVIFFSSVFLPSVVASNFTRTGQPTSYGDPETYRLLMTGIAGIAPLVVYLCTGWLPRLTGFRTLPHRGFWLSPERRASTWAWIERFSLVTSAMVGAFVVALHGTILHANSLHPAHMPVASGWLLLGGWVAFILAASVLFHQQFSRPQEPSLGSST